MKIKRCFRVEDHPLILRGKNMKEQAVIIICRICTRAISETSFYAYDLCGYYLHNSCTDIPDVINHSFHPSHPLELVAAVCRHWCDSCGQYFKGVLMYGCFDGCQYLYMDVACALMPATSSSCREGQSVQCLQHFTHQHSLSLVEKDRTECNACRSTFSGLAYGCNNCNFFLDKSCAEFPREIQHPLHSRHNLLSLRVRGSFTCSICERIYDGSYNSCRLTCNKCSFKLCLSCAKNVKRTIMYEGHDHNLQFAEKMKTELDKCNSYDGYCTQPVTANSSELNRSKSSTLQCLVCDFKLHMLCGPLPSTIKHEYHIHPLTLVDSLIEDDSGEYYCDVCETERDPRIRLYCCENCKYFAHVHCLNSEIVKVLTKDKWIGGHVELRSVGQDVTNMPNDPKLRKLFLTLHNIITKLTEQEKNLLKKYYKWDDDTPSKIVKEQPPVDNNIITNLNPQSEPIMSDEDVDASLELFRFTNSDFETFFDRQLEELFSNNKLAIKSSDLTLKTVDVEGYMIPHTVVRTMRALLRKYGDVSSDDSQNHSREWKSVVYFILCEVLRRMTTTMVIDITRGDLREWYHHLKFARNIGGFKVDFACAHLERLVRAFLGFQAEKLKDQVPAMLTKMVTKLEKEIAVAKSKLEICKAYTGSSAKSEFMRDCLKESFNMKWKKACSDRDLFPDDQQRSPMIYKTWNQ